MMTPSLQHFTRALLSPDLSFKELAQARTATDPDGMPRLMRTTRFVESVITWQGKQWLLSMPLSSAAAHSIERMAAQTGRLHTPWLVPCRILRDELCWTDPEGQIRHCDLVLQQLPAGQSFAEALQSVPTEELLTALDALERALRELNFSHNNLCSRNLRLCGGHLLPLRYHDACFGPSNDAAAFRSLREEILRSAGPMQANDTQGRYNAEPLLSGHLWCSHTFEGLVCVEDASGFGFVDTSNRRVIDSKFRWAGDFHEGRAEVETETGMGLIDRNGDYVIPPIYEIVDYIAAESIARVRKEGLWAEFDYLGHPLTDFKANNESYI